MDSTSLDDLSFAFLDVETPGLSPRYGDRVCEIAVARSSSRVDLVQATFQSLVNPERAISPGASSVNGISDDDVRNTPRGTTVSRALRRGHARNRAAALSFSLQQFAERTPRAR